MTFSELFAAGGLTLLGVLIVALALGVLVGAALGYFAASTDLDKERKAAREAGSEAGFQSGIETAWSLIGSDARRVSSVKVGKVDRRGQDLFDQDEPPLQRAMRDGLVASEAQRALELRGDD